jgi:hypothetical protein
MKSDLFLGPGGRNLKLTLTSGEEEDHPQLLHAGQEDGEDDALDMQAQGVFCYATAVRCYRPWALAASGIVLW